MKYGAVCSPELSTPDGFPTPEGFDLKLDIFHCLRPQTVRVSMFLGNHTTRRFTDQHLDRLLGILLRDGPAEMIIQSGEAADAQTAVNQLGQVIGYIDSHRDTLFAYELGNEPDVTDPTKLDPREARRRRLTAVQQIRLQFPKSGHPNLLLAISMPSQNDRDGSYFNAFVHDDPANPDNLGDMLLGGPSNLNTPDLVTVHCFGYDTLNPNDGNEPYLLINRVRGVSQAINIKVTEAGIHTVLTPSRRASLYVQFAESINANGGAGTDGGVVDSVCFHGLPEIGDADYNLSQGIAVQIGQRDATEHSGSAMLTTAVGDGSGAVTPSGPRTAGDETELVAIPAAGQGFIGWRVDGTFEGWRNPRKILMNNDHAVVAFFAPQPSFSDMPSDPAVVVAIRELATRGIVRGYGDGTFGPNDPVLRAQIAAFICRSMPGGGNPGDRSSGPNIGQQWDDEDHGNPFSDRNGVDDALWRNVGTLAFYGVAHGYPDSTFDPTGQVLRVQTISLITRAMVTKGYWVQATADDTSIYPNVPASSGHRLDLATYARNAGDLPGRPRQQSWAEWSDPAPRGWLVQVLWQALESFWRQTCAP